ncbi:hypothetical protein D9757_012526 [Collybiopsis confluens]|uniref:D-arabinitol 2-dehydrogenase [ribulose-forming] n=1 Tax=Collybiopsis confluens TaxID=2823264 RepID=A0A8H5LGX6_9AGAR|nr:hypothetical protein D9757_012526 [Collybiopsis confluens]
MANDNDSSSRDDLVKRVLPQMQLSHASNPLTAPLQATDSPEMELELSASERARRRFAVDGTAVVTGGTGAIARSAIRALLEHGASGIAIFDVPASLATSSSSIDAFKKDFPNIKILTYEVDVRNENRVREAVDQVKLDFGSIDMLLCFAGVVGSAHAADMQADDWRRVMDVNVTGSWFCAQAVGRCMITQQTGGSILFTASISGHRVNFPQPQVGYNASKAAVLQLARSLAAEWASYGIRVNSISPGYMDTILNEGEGLAAARTIWAERNPLGRMGDVEELSGAIILLCSRRAGRYITGADIVVDGGQIVF